MKRAGTVLDGALLGAVDATAARPGITRSMAIFAALSEGPRAVFIERLERRHRMGYQRKPVAGSEVAAWEPEQVWDTGEDR